MAISYEQVASAAESIKAEGGKPTLAAIYDRLGKGSMSTITKFMQRWKAGQPQQQTSEIVLPEQMKSAIVNEMERYASQRVSIVRDELEEAQRIIDSLTEESEALQIKCDNQNEQIDHLQTKNDEKRDKIKTLADEIGRLTRERSEYQTRADSLTLELATSNASNDALRRESMTANERSEAQRQHCSELQSQIQKISNSEARLTAQNESLSAQHDELKKALAVALEKTGQLAVLEAKLTQSTEVNADLKCSLQSAQSELKELSTESAKLGAMVEILEKESKKAEATKKN